MVGVCPGTGEICGGIDGVMSKNVGIFSATKQLLIRRLLKQSQRRRYAMISSMHFGPEFINFSRQDPKNKENVDNFVWTPNTGWQDLKS